MDTSRATAGQIEDAVEKAIGHIIEIMMDFDADDRDLYCEKIRERLAPFKEKTTDDYQRRNIVTGPIEL